MPILESILLPSIAVFVGIATALATKASPVAPENRPLDFEYCAYIDRIASATSAT